MLGMYMHANGAFLVAYLMWTELLASLQSN